MNRSSDSTKLARRGLIGVVAVLACAQPAWAVLGHWNRVARRTTVVVASTASAEAAAGQQQQAAAANSAKASADAAQQSAAAAQQAEAATKTQANATAQPTAKQGAQAKLKDLQSLYDQKLISASDYEAAKTKILNDMTK